MSHSLIDREDSAVILVTGATGNVGSQVARELVERGASVRAFVRNPEKARELLRDTMEIVEGDFADAASVRRALRGADSVFLSSADGPQKVAHETAVIDAAAETGVRRIVKCSTMGAEVGSPLPPFDWHGRIEEHLRQSRVPAVILRSCFYMTNLVAAAEQIRQEGKLFAPAGEGRIAMIDPRDAAAVAAVALTTDGHEGRTHVLTGPEAITYGRIAEELSGATGVPVDFVDVPDEVARHGLVAAGMPDWLVEHLVALFPLIRQGTFEETTETVPAVTGRGGPLASSRETTLMPSSRASSQGTAELQGELWGARAENWAAQEERHAPLYEEVIGRIGLGPGTRVLDVGCASGVFCRVAADRGAVVFGLDASEALIAIARRRVPEADLRVGDLQFLPFEADMFDVVTGFNSFQFAGDITAALREAARVARKDARVVIQVWGRTERCDLTAAVAALAPLRPPPPSDAGTPVPQPLWEPEVLEAIATEAGLVPAAIASRTSGTT